MNMPKVAVGCGVLLIIQGAGFYVGTGASSVTSLIPAFIGLPILLLGLLAFREAWRKHAMHAAAAFGLLGLLAAVGRIASAGWSLSAAGTSLMLMILLCGGFIVLCIKSFRDARRRQRESAE
jgi:uncharacterized membrane protein